MNQTIKNRIEDINNGIVPEGYKQTAFGIFPCDWETDKNYGDLFEFSGSLSKSREELGEKGYAYLHYGDMHKNSFNTVSYEKYSDLPKVDIDLNGKEKYLMKDGDVIFLDASEDVEGTSRCVLVDNPNEDPFFAGLHTIVAKEKQNVFSKWYKQYITLPNFVKKQFHRLACGFKVYGLNKETIATIKYAFPKDQKEQDEIAKILMKWDETVELQEQYIEKLELRKKAYIDKFFTEKNYNCLFKDLYVQAGEGGTPDTKKEEYYIDGNIPFVKIEHLSEKYIRMIGSYITEEGMKKSSAWLIPSNSLIFSNGATIGECSINKIPVTTKQGILGIVPSNNIKVEYFYYLLKSEYFLNKVKKITTKGTMCTAYLKDIDKLKLFIHSQDEQVALMKLLGTIDEEISLQKEKLEKLKQQRKAMQQYLLTGIVRVV